MRKRYFHRAFGILGIIAMFGALVTIPLVTTYAFAMAGNVAAGDHATAMPDDMPCHKPSKPAHCPQKVCPEMSTCLVKCFQPLPAPVAEARLAADVPADRVPPGLMQAKLGSLIPPLLRPPSV